MYLVNLFYNDIKLTHIFKFLSLHDSCNRFMCTVCEAEIHTVSLPYYSSSLNIITVAYFPLDNGLWGWQVIITGPEINSYLKFAFSILSMHTISCSSTYTRKHNMALFCCCSSPQVLPSKKRKGRVLFYCGGDTCEVFFDESL